MDTLAHFDVLVVEDDLDIRTSMEDLLRDEGYTVCVAADGLEALRILRAAPDEPNLIIVDLMMPRMTGWELADAMRHDASLCEIPILVMSAGESSSDAHAEIRGLPFLRKPIHAERLLEHVARRCGARRTEPYRFARMAASRN